MNLTGITYSFGCFGVRIYVLYGLLPLCRISRKRITKVYTEATATNFFDSLGRAFSGWQFGNRTTRTTLVIETDIFFFRRLYLTPKDARAAIALLSYGGHASSPVRPGLTA